jgi:hypothetical protein
MFGGKNVLALRNLELLAGHLFLIHVASPTHRSSRRRNIVDHDRLDSLRARKTRSSTSKTADFKVYQGSPETPALQRSEKESRVEGLPRDSFLGTLSRVDEIQLLSPEQNASAPESPRIDESNPKFGLTIYQSCHVPTASPGQSPSPVCEDLKTPSTRSYNVFSPQQLLIYDFLNPPRLGQCSLSHLR